VVPDVGTGCFGVAVHERIFFLTKTLTCTMIDKNNFKESFREKAVTKRSTHNPLIERAPSWERTLKGSLKVRMRKVASKPGI
jgi:hypothetical protein